MATIAQRQTRLSSGLAFRAIWSKSLRAYRVPILAWGIGLGLTMMATAAASPSISTATGQASVSDTIQSFSFFANPVAIGTPQGYTTFKGLALLPLFLGIWTIIAGAYLTRGEEERGSLDVLLGEPVSRARLISEKIIALALGTTMVGLLVTLGLMLGMAQAKLPADVGGALLAGVNITLTAFVYAALALFFSQFTRTAGAAAGLAGAYMALDFVVAGAVRASNGPEWISRLTINYYSELSKPIIPGYGANAGALLVLLGMSLALVAASIWLFVRRDTGDIIPLWPQTRSASGLFSLTTEAAMTRAQNDLSLRGITARALAASRASILWWIVGIGAFGVYSVFLAKSVEQAFSQIYQSSAVIAALFSGQNLATNNGFVGAILFTFIPFTLVLAAMFFAISWANDLDRGQLENVLSEPLPRWRLPLERFITVIVGVVGLGLVSWLAPLLGAALAGLTLDSGKLASAGLGMIPLGLLTGALVYALAGRLSSPMILGVVGGLASLSYLAELLRSVLKLPDWVFNLSIFHVYGQPMVNGINWTGTLVMLALALALLAFATYRFTRADVRN
jgi:ABC-2 type transport system permease protein